jgi:hypothetical protein
LPTRAEALRVVQQMAKLNRIGYCSVRMLTGTYDTKWYN